MALATGLTFVSTLRGEATYHGADGDGRLPPTIRVRARRPSSPASRFKYNTNAKWGGPQTKDDVHSIPPGSASKLPPAS
jgi:hypothetical protein